MSHARVQLPTFSHLKRCENDVCYTLAFFPPLGYNVGEKVDKVLVIKNLRIVLKGTHTSRIGVQRLKHIRLGC